jgi:hypothetical protein
VGVRITYDSYWEHGDEENSTLGRVRDNSFGGEGNSYGERDKILVRKFVWPRREVFTDSFWDNKGVQSVGS